MKTKTFDCVAMKHRGAQWVREQIKNMTLEQQLKFWGRGTRELLEIQRTARRKATRGRQR